MVKYAVPMTTWASITVEVETDETDPEVIFEAARGAHEGTTLCHRCADSRNSNLDVGDDWEPVRVGKDGPPEVTRID